MSDTERPETSSNLSRRQFIKAVGVISTLGLLYTTPKVDTVLAESTFIHYGPRKRKKPKPA
jgi:hypothetical protein